MNKQAEIAVLKARTALLLDHFFFGRLAMHLTMVQDPSIPTLAVDGKHIFYNPDFVLELKADLTKSAIAHEIMHCVYKHFLRRQGRDPVLWNKAGDYCINADIKDSGFRLGDGWLYNPAFRGMSAEEIYDLLKQDESNGQGGQHGGALCEIRDGADGQAEAEEQKMNWEIAVTQAAQAAKQAGKLPKSMERFVTEFTKPQVPWRELLQRFITELTKDDYSWTRLNKRYLGMGLYMPSLYSERMGPIDVVVDTSGSISPKVLSAFAAEIQAIVNAVQPARLRVIYCDAAVHRVDEFGPGEELKFEMCGGGGTDFRPPFAMIDQEDEKPQALVYLTDLEGPAPQTEPEYPVMWCCTTDHVGPWGETLKVSV